MAHAQKPDFVFRRKGRVHLNRQGASVQLTAGSRDVRISGSNAGYTMFRGSMKSTGYPLHSLVSSSILLPCVTVCRHISTGLYHIYGSSWESNNTNELNFLLSTKYEILTTVRVNCWINVQPGSYSCNRILFMSFILARRVRVVFVFIQRCVQHGIFCLVCFHLT
jgi:hypothetical protein